MIRENQTILKTLNVIADAAVIVLAMMLSYFLRFVLFDGEVSMPVTFYLNSALLISPLFLIICAAEGLYESQRAIDFIRVAERLGAACLICTLVLGAVFFTVRSVEVSRWTLVFFFILSFLLSMAKRRAVLAYLHGARAKGRGLKSVILIGSGENAPKYIKAVENNRRIFRSDGCFVLSIICCF